MTRQADVIAAVVEVLQMAGDVEGIAAKMDRVDFLHEWPGGRGTETILVDANGRVQDSLEPNGWVDIADWIETWIGAMSSEDDVRLDAIIARLR